MNLIHSRSFPIERYRSALDEDGIQTRQIDSISDVESGPETMSVVVLDSDLAGNGKEISPGTAIICLVERPSWIHEDHVFSELAGEPTPVAFLSTLKRAYQELHRQKENDRLEVELQNRNQELEEISKVSIALSTVRDHNVLLSMILTKSRELSRADAGSLYLLDDHPEGGIGLRWKLAQNDSIPVHFEERVLPITKRSLAGYVALTHETLVIDDAYELPEGTEYAINTSFDIENGYLTRSMLVFPMTNHVGDIIGVLQLINRKRNGAPSRLTAATVPHEVIPFDDHTIKLMRSLAGQAAVALENNILYESIERLFEGFVTASVTAIEQRDPTTSGHSFRVADLTVELARTVDSIQEGRFRDIYFSVDQLKEIRYASLLHDFGKVGVREKILVKEKKLYPMQLDVIRSRFDYVARSLEASSHARRLQYLRENGNKGFDVFHDQAEAELAASLKALEMDFQFVVQSNEPTVLPEGEFQHLLSLGLRSFVDLRGELKPLLSDEEVRILSIRKGNLDSVERTEIESHVTHTFRFLSKIPWTRDLRSVPDIAYAHHEKLNGRGYPRGLPAESISIQSRMMTISDIYDALTAKDRPYKRAVPLDRALDILRMEVKDGLLDGGIVDVFVEAKVFEKA
ncbi:MAG TPA: HD domain-containing phosphohydrolase, partial [Thermoanaerobaculia bacterium]|nr:HD domain-containing phosphohydrolase [Thermoanaerobaculia bacterium]